MSVRDWLDKNKVFFETISAVLLAAMAIIVSYEANQIASYQTELIRLEHQPFLDFDIDLAFDPIESKYTHDRLTISNVGSPLSEFDCQHAVFFKVEYGEIEEKLRSAMIPLIGYYDTTFQTNNPRGKLATLANSGITEGNNWKTTQTTLEFMNFARKKNATGFAEIVRYIRVCYKDIFGETHDEVYFVDTLGTHKLPEIEGKKIFEEYESKFSQKRFLEFSSASPELIYEKWLMIIQESKEQTK